MKIDLCSRDYYESNKQVKIYSTDKKLQVPERVILQKYESEIKNKKILDIGCGGGRTTEYLTNISTDYIGLDYAKAMVDSCKKQYPDYKFIQGDFRDLSNFKDNTFDFILFSFNGIDSVSHEGRLMGLSEIYRILKPDSLFVFSAHNLNYKNIPYVPRIFTSFNPIFLSKNIVKRILYLKNKNLEIHTDEYSTITCPASSYLSHTYYIKKEKQIDQLARTGFKNYEIVDLDGKFLNITSPDSDYCWLYYTCRK